MALAAAAACVRSSGTAVLSHRAGRRRVPTTSRPGVGCPLVPSTRPCASDWMPRPSASSCAMPACTSEAISASVRAAPLGAGPEQFTTQLARMVCSMPSRVRARSVMLVSLADASRSRQGIRRSMPSRSSRSMWACTAGAVRWRCTSHMARACRRNRARSAVSSRPHSVAVWVRKPSITLRQSRGVPSGVCSRSLSRSHRVRRDMRRCGCAASSTCTDAVRSTGAGRGTTCARGSHPLRESIQIGAVRFAPSWVRLSATSTAVRLDPMIATGSSGRMCATDAGRHGSPIHRLRGPVQALCSGSRGRGVPVAITTPSAFMLRPSDMRTIHAAPARSIAVACARCTVNRLPRVAASAAACVSASRT